MFPAANTNFSEVKSLDPKAKPSLLMPMKEVFAVEIVKGTIRDAKVSGVFKIAGVEKPFSVRGGRLRVCVECLWKGRKPRTTWMHITLGRVWKIHHSYDGEICVDIR
jgi:hypothetical protein